MRPITAEMAKRTIATKKISFAMSTAAPAIPPKPKMAATRATIRKVIAQPIMVVTSLSDRRTADDEETTPTLTAGSTVKVVPSGRGTGNRLSAATLTATFGGSFHDAHRRPSCRNDLRSPDALLRRDRHKYLCPGAGARPANSLIPSLVAGSSSTRTAPELSGAVFVGLARRLQLSVGSPPFGCSTEP